MTYRRTCAPRRLWWALALAGAGVVASAFGGEPAPALPLRHDTSVELWRTGLKALFSTVLALAAVAGVLYAWRRRFLDKHIAPATSEATTVEWARRVSPKTTLLVVRWQGRRYLLAENAGSTRLIDSRSIEGSLS